MLDRAGDGSERHHVADGELVLDQDEEPGKEVPDQSLRPERDRQSDHRGGRDDGGDVEA